MWRFTAFEALLGPEDYNPDVTLPVHSSGAGRNAVARNARRSSRSRPAALKGRRGCERRAEGAMWGRLCGSGRILLLPGAARHCGRPHRYGGAGIASALPRAGGLPALLP